MGAGASFLAHFDRFQGMDDGKRTTEVHQFLAHGDTWIQAVYTNEGRTVERILAMYLEWLKDEKFRFVGLDLEYDLRKEKIAVMHIAMKEHVLVFHLIRYVFWRCHFFLVLHFLPTLVLLLEIQQI